MGYVPSTKGVPKGEEATGQEVLQYWWNATRQRGRTFEHWRWSGQLPFEGVYKRQKRRNLMKIHRQSDNSINLEMMSSRMNYLEEFQRLSKQKDKTAIRWQSAYPKNWIHPRCTHTECDHQSEIQPSQTKVRPCRVNA